MWILCLISREDTASGGGKAQGGGQKMGCWERQDMGEATGCREGEGRVGAGSRGLGDWRGRARDAIRWAR